MVQRIVSLSACVAFGALAGCQSSGSALSVSAFRVDATPALGSPLCHGGVAPAKRIDDRLSARGIVLLTGEAPIVLCVVDWVGIGNEGHDAWRKALAEAVGTTPRRVTVHAVHQHDAPGCDFSAERLLARRGIRGELFDTAFARETMRRTAAAARDGLARARRVSHVGVGQARVEKVASNRRVLGPDGKVKHVRYSSCRNAEAIAAPEGVIDPYVKLISLWDGDAPIVAMTYYATHPQSHYGKGGVSADFVGLARARRERDLPNVAHVHFNGAGGNVAAGKYNDGSPQRRPELAGRLAAGMKAAWENTTKKPIAASDVEWRVEPVTLPLRDIMVEAKFAKILDDPDARLKERLRAARDLAYTRRVRAGHQIELSCLRLGDAYILHMPGELFVEYQLAAQRMRPNNTVCMAAYGDYGPGYIGTEIAYSQGGYETSRVSRTAPGVEAVLMSAMKDLLR